LRPNCSSPRAAGTTGSGPKLGRWPQRSAAGAKPRRNWSTGRATGSGCTSARPVAATAPHCARERAFGLLGLAEFERGLHLRPDNLAGGVAALRERLRSLLPPGTESGTVFVLGGLAPADAEHAASLWDGAALDAGYRDTTAQLTAWLESAQRLPLARAARESFVLGNDAIRRVVFDPLLPAPLVDAQARARFTATVARFDAAGRRIWRRFLAATRSTSAHGRVP
jgi:phenylacetic acid degradation operon negative regulatory protein